MDRFLWTVNSFCLIAQCVTQLLFTGALTGNRPRVPHFVGYLFALGVVEQISFRFGLPEICAIGAELFILYGLLCLMPATRRSVAFLAAVLALYFTQLPFGVVDSIEMLLFPDRVPDVWLRPLMVLFALVALALCVLCYAAVLRLTAPFLLNVSFSDGASFSPAASLSAGSENTAVIPGNEPLPLLLLLLPELFFFFAQLYILNTSYQVLSLPLSAGEIGKHALLLVLQVLSLAAALCTLYAYRHIRKGCEAQAALASLRQAAEAQKIYLAEAQTRYAQTRAFRHDLQNHLAVLGGLLNSGKTDEGRAYLQKLAAVSASLSFPCHTGDPVADIILGEKLGIAKAKGISTDLSLTLPEGLGMDAPDLCVIFANALDNALQACEAVEDEKWIRIRGVRQGDFYLLTFENSCVPGPMPPMGTGLCNIRATVEKQGGAMRTEKSGAVYSLDLLLNISQQHRCVSPRLNIS